MARHQYMDALPHLVAPTDALRGVYRVRIRRSDIDPADLVAEALAKPAECRQAGLKREDRILLRALEHSRIQEGPSLIWRRTNEMQPVPRGTDHSEPPV
jgi:hypothetical protein